MELSQPSSSTSQPLFPKNDVNQERKQLKTKVKAYVADYCNCSSIQGVRYLAEDRSPLGKAIWTLGILVGIIACVHQIKQSWDLRRDNPVFLALSKTQEAVWNVPFPAITICPFQKLMETNNYKKKDACVYDMLCERDVTCENISDVIDYLEKFSPKPADMFLHNMFYLGDDIQKLEPILSNEGMCYSFNMVPGSALFESNTFHASRLYLNNSDRVQWDERKGYSNNSLHGVYPHRTQPGTDAGVLILLKMSRDVKEKVNNLTCFHINGFQIKVHNPYDLPNEENDIFVAPPSHANIKVTPRQVVSDDFKESYTPTERQCYYPNEKKLQFFKMYTQINCQQDCLSRIALDCCGCVGFYMPRDVTTPVCRKAEDAMCLLSAKDHVSLEASNLDYSGRCRNISISCNCLPTCTNLQYNSHASQLQLDSKQVEQILTSMDLEVEKGFDYTVVNIFFTNSHFVPFRRMELYSTVEFYANVGGLLGLFLGISVLSFVEVFYWIFVRPWYHRAPSNNPSSEETTPLSTNIAGH